MARMAEELDEQERSADVERRQRISLEDQLQKLQANKENVRPRRVSPGRGRAPAAPSW